MARMIPLRTEAELIGLAEKNPAEADVYRCCVDLPDNWVVLHGLRTITIESGEGARDREGDFVVLHPDFGLLVVEVKGGRVQCDEGRWFRRKKGVDEALDPNPLTQALEFKHALLGKLHAHIEWGPLASTFDGARELARHAVLLPQVADVSVVRGIQVEQELVGGGAEMHGLENWIERAFRFGSSEESWMPLGDAGVAAAVGILAAPFTTQPLLSFTLLEAERERITLTSEQFRAITALRDKDRLAIAGGAGTGKTLIAFKRAQQCAEADLRTLLLCYNRPLADALGHQAQGLVNSRDIRDGKLVVNTFDGLARALVGTVSATTRQDYEADAAADYPRADPHSVHLPVALEYALDDKIDAVPEFDVVLIDEGQDFGDPHWASLQRILDQARRVAVFFDTNQSIYRRADRFPFSQDQTVSLTRNCRNTDPIHDAAYTYYTGPQIEPAALWGEEVVQWEAPTVRGQAVRIAKEVATWVERDRVPLESVAVLLMQGADQARVFPAARRAFEKRGLPLSVQGHWHAGHVLIDTVRRFKGLEADIVILWHSTASPAEDAGALRYVGRSRAKSLLVVVGDADSLRAAALEVAAKLPSDRPAPDQESVEPTTLERHE